jgi:predicted DNA-binding WGR domain protein
MRYENRKGTHYKFYEIDLIPGPTDSQGRDTYAVRAKWGKIGTEKPRSEIKKVGLFDECFREMERLINRRVRKQYEKITEK